MTANSIQRQAVCAITILTLVLIVVSSAPPIHAQGPPTQDITLLDKTIVALQKKAASLEAAGKFKEASAAYAKVGKLLGQEGDALEAAGKHDESAAKQEASADAYVKAADMETKAGAGTAAPAGAAPAPAGDGTYNPALAPPAADAAPDTAPNAAPETPAANVMPLPPLHNRDANGRPIPFVKLSQFTAEGHGTPYTDIAAGADGVLHAVFTESPAIGKPVYLFYRASSDGGKSWSEPKNLSDDESGNPASYARVVVDGQGRVYAIWKYIDANALLDGPGGDTAGTLTYRVLENGAWSKRISLGIANYDFSWFPAVDPHGSLQVIWSQTAADAIAALPLLAGSSNYAELVQQVALDGATPGAVKVLIQPKALPTKAEQDARPIGEAMRPGELTPKAVGIWNLRGYVDAGGVAHFVGERAMNKTGDLVGVPDPQLLTIHWDTTGIVHWDGQKLEPLYKYETRHNWFEKPPTLLLDDKGREHLLRIAEKAEVPSVRDYLITIDGGKATLSDDPVTAISAKAEGEVISFQASQAPGGRMLVTSLQKDKGVDELDLYLTIYDNGKWTPPLAITDSAYRQSFFSKDTGGGSSVSQSASYLPKFAAAAIARSGHPVVLMNSAEHVILGQNTAGTLGGAPVIFSSGASLEHPMVFFVRL